ncbi:hypothetical protein ACIHFD_46430 [Nonomuraea sp. NPDC051941]
MMGYHKNQYTTRQLREHGVEVIELEGFERRLAGGVGWGRIEVVH